MADRHKELGFVEEPAFHVFAAVPEFWMQQLERILHAVRRGSEVDLSHSAGPERSHDRAVTKPVALRERQFPVFSCVVPVRIAGVL